MTKLAAKWEIITKDTVDNESYYNLCQLVGLLGYAYPDKAIKENELQVAVWKDTCGNIVRLA